MQSGGKSHAVSRFSKIAAKKRGDDEEKKTRRGENEMGSLKMHHP
jgi:hypothetical protein